MIQNNRSRLFIMIVGVLTIVNLAAITTVVIHIRRFHANDFFKPDPITVQNDSMVNARGPEFLFRELGFDEKQKTAFLDSRKSFRDDAQPLFQEIRKLNADLMDEIVKDEPDILKLEGISNQIGQLHARVKQLTNRHLLEVKSIATPDQKEKLGFFYRELINRDSGPMGKGNQHRFRHGQRNAGNN